MPTLEPTTHSPKSTTHFTCAERLKANGESKCCGCFQHLGCSETEPDELEFKKHPYYQLGLSHGWAEGVEKYKEHLKKKIENIEQNKNFDRNCNPECHKVATDIILKLL
jgi:hypothetical protein